MLRVLRPGKGSLGSRSGTQGNPRGLSKEHFWQRREKLGAAENPESCSRVPGVCQGQNHTYRLSQHAEAEGEIQFCTSLPACRFFIGRMLFGALTCPM